MAYAVRICSEANPGFFLAAQGTTAKLAPDSTQDPHQQWIKHDKWGIDIQDTYGFPAFALVNKSTNFALKHGEASLDPVFLGDYDDQNKEDAALWTFSADVGSDVRSGHHFMRPSTNITLNMDVKGGQVEDNSKIVLFECNYHSTQKWKAHVVSA